MSGLILLGSQLGTLPATIADGIPTFTVGNGDSQASGSTSAAVSMTAVGSIPATLCSPANNPVARLPVKLVTRIEGLQFVEMTELLPESWGSEQPTADGQLKPVTRRAVIEDISIWAECYTLVASVLARKYPASAPDLFAHMRRVMRSAKKFEGTGWVAYDRMYRRQALAQLNPHHRLLWAVEDATLYNEVFVGHARIIHRCSHCLSEHHSSEACPARHGSVLPPVAVPDAGPETGSTPTGWGPLKPAESSMRIAASCGEASIAMRA